MKNPLGTVPTPGNSLIKRRVRAGGLVLSRVLSETFAFAALFRSLGAWN